MGHDFNPTSGYADPDKYEILKSRSLNMRLEPTLAESRLWECLKGDQLGVRFRRQHVISQYIVDFICLRQNLIIEVDGEYHQTQEQQTADHERTLSLEQMGYTVLRFTNDQVLYEIEYVMESIESHIHV